MITIQRPEPVFVEGFSPAGAPRAERVADIAEVGHIFRGRIRQLLFAPGGELLVAAGLGVEVLDPDTLELRQRWLSDEYVLWLAAAGSRLLVAVRRAEGVALFAAEPGAKLGAPLAESDYVGETYSTDSDFTQVALPVANGVHVYRVGGKKRLEFLLGPEVEKAIPYLLRVQHARLSPDGRFVAALAGGTAYAVWEIDTGRIVMRGVRGDGDVPDSLLFLPDGRLLMETRSSYSAYDLSQPANRQYLSLGDGFNRRTLFMGGGRLLAVGGFGEYEVRSPASFETLSQGQGEPNHYGAVPGSPVGAISRTHVATYAASYGTLWVTGTKTVTRRDHVSSLEGLSVSADGRRLVVESQWRETCHAIDVAAKTRREVVSEEGLVGPAVSADGSQVILGCGTNLKPRTLHTVSFDGGTPEPVHKILAWARRTKSFGGDFYAVATYKLRGDGYVSVHRLGQPRAVAKLTFEDESPWVFDVAPDGSQAIVRWKHTTTLHDLTRKGAIVETLPLCASSVALGPGGALALTFPEDSRETLLVRTASGEKRVPLPPVKGHGSSTVAFSEDGSLVFAGRPSGMLELRRASDGKLLRALQAHAAPIEHLETAGGLLWSLGKDDVVRAFGVPGEARAKQPAPKAVKLSPLEAEELPKQLPWTADVPLPEQPTLNLGSRVLQVRYDGADLALFDEEGKPVKALRKLKTDDARAFDTAKEQWAQVRETQKKLDTATRRLLSGALRTGRSATAGELRAQLQHPGMASQYENTLWESLDGKQRVAVSKGALTESLPDTLRLRLLHPARLDARSLADLRKKYPDAAQLTRAVHTPTRPDGTEVDPVHTDWAKTQNATIIGTLMQKGFHKNEESAHANCALELRAPELGAVALVDLDEEHGIPTLSFHRWDGTPSGGEALPFRDVDPQLYSEAFQAVLDAFPRDRD
jgi:hypothetical protein